MTPLAGAEQAAMLAALDRGLVAWLDDGSFALAVDETVARTGYAAADVESQLRHVVLRARGRTMELVLAAELGADADLAGGPGTVLVLASGGVPGLAIEGIAAALAVGATALVRPSRDETVLHHVLAALRIWEPELARRIEVVGAAGEPVPWGRAEAAIVFGTDETIALVRSRLSPAAAGRVAGYGSRQGIAVVLPGAEVDASWAERLADDVCMFRQRGCMSPGRLFVVGSDAEAAPLIEAVSRELAPARDRHTAAGVDDRLAQRQASDADALAAIASGTPPGANVLHAGAAQLEVVRVDDLATLRTEVTQLGARLQTAVIAGPYAERAALATLLLDAGCTRICTPGTAHEPDPLWPQDGIGRVAPLLGRAPASA